MRATIQAGPSVRHRCLQALLRMLYYSSSEVLRDVLSNINTGRCVSRQLLLNKVEFTNFHIPF
jgi:hypothetical protein